MAHLTSILEVAAALAMTGGLVWISRVGPSPVRVRLGEMRDRPRRRR